MRREDARGWFFRGAGWGHLGCWRDHRQKHLFLILIAVGSCWHFK